MADPVITYTRLGNAIATVKAALDWLIPKVKSSGAEWSANKFVTTDGGQQLSAQTGFATTAPPQASGVGSAGAQNVVARSDHYHPNTCPTPTFPTDLVDKNYVDNLQVICASLHAYASALNVYTAASGIPYSTIGSEYGIDAVIQNSGSGLGSYFKILTSGKYRISYFGSYTASAAADVIAYVNITRGSSHIETYIGSQGTRAGTPATYVGGSASGILDLQVDDEVRVLVKTVGTTLTITHAFAGFSIEKV